MRLPPRVRMFAVDNHMWAEKLLAFQAALPGAQAGLAGDVLSVLRMRKSPAEVEALRRAGAAIDRVHRSIGEWLRPGRTEREVAKDIAEAIVASGHTTTDFVIVGSGPNGASPHHEVSDRVIRASTTRWSSTSAAPPRTATARTPPAPTPSASPRTSSARCTRYCCAPSARRPTRYAPG